MSIVKKLGILVYKGAVVLFTVVILLSILLVGLLVGMFVWNQLGWWSIPAVVVVVAIIVLGVIGSDEVGKE